MRRSKARVRCRRGLAMVSSLANLGARPGTQAPERRLSAIAFHGVTAPDRAQFFGRQAFTEVTETFWSYPS